MTDLTQSQWHKIVKKAIYLKSGRYIALKELHDILGRQRTVEQNRTQMLWHKEASQQLKSGTPKDMRAFAKLHIAIPLLCSEDAEFKAQYDKVIGPMPYETKLALMVEPFDFPATRLMSKRQKSDYLTALKDHYESQGVQLTIPDSH